MVQASSGYVAGDTAEPYQILSNLEQGTMVEQQQEGALIFRIARDSERLQALL